MTRVARVHGDCQHIIVRGIGKQILFEDQADYKYYLKLLKRHSKETVVEIIAFCLMDNHVHLLIRDLSGNTALFMQKLGISYAAYFNKKYDRVGHLFQNRYKSELVDNEPYLLAVYRYILNNPVKAGIAKADEYPWSSYREYFRTCGLTDQECIRALIGDEENYKRFLSTEDETECMEYESKRHDDRWAKMIIRKKLGITSGTELQSMDRVSRNRALVMLKDAGLTVRQLERLTGINRGVIQRA